MPEFVAGDSYTRVVLYAPREFSQLTKLDRIRACYQHACLKTVLGEAMTNQTLRERLGIKESNYFVASRIISDTIAANLIKPSDPENRSRKYAS